LLALIYLALRRMLALILLRCRSQEFKELEIVVLRHELEILRRQTRRPELRPADRAFLAAASRLLPRKRWRSLFVTPDTLLRWHRQLVARRWTYAQRSPGRPRVGSEVRDLILRLARENPRWGYQRIARELGGLGVPVSATTVRKLLREAGLGPAGKRAGLTWREFIRHQAATMIACDFFTVDTFRSTGLYVLFFIELGSRRVHLAGLSQRGGESSEDIFGINPEATGLVIAAIAAAVVLALAVWVLDVWLVLAAVIAFGLVFAAFDVREVDSPGRRVARGARGDRWRLGRDSSERGADRWPWVAIRGS
jgi:transposase